MNERNGIELVVQESLSPNDEELIKDVNQHLSEKFKADDENINTRIDVQHVLNFACMDWNDIERTKAQFAFHMTSMTKTFQRVDDPSGENHIDESETVTDEHDETPMEDVTEVIEDRVFEVRKKHPKESESSYSSSAKKRKEDVDIGGTKSDDIAIKPPQKKRRVVIETSSEVNETGEDVGNASSKSESKRDEAKDEESQSEESEKEDSENEESEDELTQITGNIMRITRGKRHGKQPRKMLQTLEGRKTSVERTPMKDRLRRESARKKTKPYSPPSNKKIVKGSKKKGEGRKKNVNPQKGKKSPKKKASSVGDGKKANENVGEVEDNVNPEKGKKSPNKKASSVGEGKKVDADLGEVDDDDKSVGSQVSTLSIPWKDGRERNPSFINVRGTDKESCSLCSEVMGTKGAHFFGGENKLARVCGLCAKKNPVVIDVKEMYQITNKRGKENTKKCLLCEEKINIGNHRFGEYRFCRECVSEGRCKCAYCRQLKPKNRNILQCLWDTSMEVKYCYVHVDEDFSNKNQISLLLSSKRVVPIVGEVLSCFTSNLNDNQATALSANQLDLSYQDLLSFGSMKAFNAKNSKVPTSYRWTPCKGNGRSTNENVMRYAGELLQNDVTLSIPPCENFHDLNLTLRDAIAKCRLLKNGIFSFRYIQIFHNMLEQTQGYDWTSFVVDLKIKHLNYFGHNKTTKNVIWGYLNHLLQDEAKFQNIEYDTDDKTFLYFGIQSEFKLQSGTEDFNNDTGVLSILHAWTLTSPDIYGSGDKYDTEDEGNLNTFDLVDKESVERFRQLVLFWLIGNDMNMHLYIDCRDKEIPVVENEEIME